MVEGTGSVQGVQGGYGSVIIGGGKYDTAWASGRGDMELENFGHGGRVADIPDGLPDQGKSIR